MTIVLRPGQSVTSLVGAGNRLCPACRGRLRRWGNARWRVVRDAAGDWRLRPSRVRCDSCGVTQVVLPSEVLVRRRDAVVNIGAAWRLFAGGAGARRTARTLGLPMETVRGWLRRLKTGGRTIYGASAGDDHDRLQWGLAEALDRANRASWQSEKDVWRFVAYHSQGRLLSNTS